LHEKWGKTRHHDVGQEMPALRQANDAEKTAKRERAAATLTVIRDELSQILALDS